jgi:hypothetical protein
LARSGAKKSVSTMNVVSTTPAAGKRSSFRMNSCCHDEYTSIVSMRRPRPNAR